ncbi:MAG: succinate dehydrogenase cytochrome b subunit [Bowdeniella nasicola]|nr:succinate dehydrogenase cytochrome b subunit [Bowdeniella nasicola]
MVPTHTNAALREDAVRQLPRASTLPGVDPEGLPRGRIRARRHRVRPATWMLTTCAAISGLLLAAFVLVHMVGNLKVYQGPEAFNAYAQWLRVAGAPLLPGGALLWGFRLTLLLTGLVHIWSTLVLRLRAARARGSHRARQRVALGRWMLPSGMVLLIFVILHILDLTTGTVNPDFTPANAGTSFAYQNLLASFSMPLFATVYILAMVALGVHLTHGLGAAATSLGVRGTRTRAIWMQASRLLGVGIALVNISIPLAVQWGLIV